MDTPRSDLEIIESTQRPAFVLARDYQSGETIAAHSHSVAQLLHTLTGVILAETLGRAWAVPPGRALWIPPGVSHSFSMSGAVRVRTLYVRAAEAAAMPSEPAVLLITPLIRELILRLMALDAAPDETASLATALLLAELRSTTHESLSLPLPRSPTLQAFTRQVRSDPSDRRPLSDVASALGLSAKTLSRHFAEETGLTPDAWRRHARLLTAIAELESGKTVTQVAFDLGFESVSSFSAAFRETFGITPRGVRIRHSKQTP